MPCIGVDLGWHVMFVSFLVLGHNFCQEEAELLISTAEASFRRPKQRRAARSARRAARSAARLQRAARQAEEALQRVERGKKRKKI